MKYYEKLLNNDRILRINRIGRLVSDMFYLDENNQEPVIRTDDNATYSMKEFKRLIDWGNKLFEEVEDED